MTHHTAVLDTIKTTRERMQNINNVLDRLEAEHTSDSHDHAIADLDDNERSEYRHAILQILDALTLETHTLRHELAHIPRNAIT